ncbi:hypothetical protein V6N13_059694 [Hibiscus sabdariffa]
MYSLKCNSFLYLPYDIIQILRLCILLSISNTANWLDFSEKFYCQGSPALLSSSLSVVMAWYFLCRLAGCCFGYSGLEERSLRTIRLAGDFPLRLGCSMGVCQSKISSSDRFSCSVLPDPSDGSGGGVAAGLEALPVGATGSGCSEAGGVGIAIWMGTVSTISIFPSDDCVDQHQPCTIYGLIVGGGHQIPLDKGVPQLCLRLQDIDQLVYTGAVIGQVQYVALVSSVL